MYLYTSNKAKRKTLEIMTSMQILKSEKLVLNFLSLGADLETANRLAGNQIARESYVRPMKTKAAVFLTKFDGTPLR